MKNSENNPYEFEDGNIFHQVKFLGRMYHTEHFLFQEPLVIHIPYKRDMIYETKSLKGLVSTLLTSEYIDTTDINAQFKMRYSFAIDLAIRNSLGSDPIKIYDSRYGILPLGDGKRKEILNHHVKEPLPQGRVIRIENDRMFIKSLITLDFINVWERTDSSILIKHDCWNDLYNGNKHQDCSNCAYNIKTLHKCYCSNGINTLLPIPEEEKNCCLFYTPEAAKEGLRPYIDGKYIFLNELSDEDIVGQEYIEEYQIGR